MRGLLAAAVAFALVAPACDRSRTAQEGQDEPADRAAQGAVDAAEAPMPGATCEQICEKNLELSYREGGRRATEKLSPAERAEELRKAERGWANRHTNPDVMRVLKGCIKACDTEWTPERRRCEGRARDFAAFQACLR